MNIIINKTILIKDAYFLKTSSLPLIIHNFNYGDLINSGVIPSAYWENTRIKYIRLIFKNSCSKFCDKCNSHRAFVVDVIDYLKSVVRTLSPYPSILVSGHCIECQNSLSTRVMSLPFGSVV